MSQETGQPTIGQEFTSRWIAKRDAARFNSATLMRDMAEAIDEYVKSRPEIAESLMREIAMAAAEGNETFFKETSIDGKTVTIASRQLLRSPALVAVASKHHLGGPQPWQFPA